VTHKEFVLEGKALNSVFYAHMLRAVVEVDFERGQVSRERQLISFSWHCHCSFCHCSETPHNILWHGRNQPPALFT
jgi:hypothetical protein